MQGLIAMAGGMTSIEGGRGAIKKRRAEIEKRIARRPAMIVSMMGAADNGVGSGRWNREGCNNQPLTLIRVVKASGGWQR
jgi:hypothetical protein